MKYKNFLLVTFFLTLFVFQQVQAGATIPPKGNPSQDSFAPPHAPMPAINVFVLWLNNNNTIDTITWGGPHKCLIPYENHGCGIIDPEQPTAPRNPVPITVDPYYLRDVITIEMNVGQIPPTPLELPALKAQAIAARTVADWKFRNQPYDEDFGTGVVGINNSTQYQVFIPGSYNDYPAAQPLIDQAITETQGQFLSYEPDGSYSDGRRKTIDAEFSSDIIPESRYGNQGYLQIIQEPISSSTCNVQGTVGNDWGMSQRGAIRWAIGNTCPDESGTSWLVQWTDYRQILVHYYTGVDILNASGGKVAPDDRWNLLNFNNNQPLSMVGGQVSYIPIQLQNTSIADWADGEMVLGYRWSNTEPWTAIYAIPETIKGDDANITIQIPAPALDGTYTLHLDVRRQNDPNSWFSQQAPIPWFDAQIPSITVVGNSTATFTPTATPTTTVNYALQFNPTDAPK